MATIGYDLSAIHKRSIWKESNYLRSLEKQNRYSRDHSVEKMSKNCLHSMQYSCGKRIQRRDQPDTNNIVGKISNGCCSGRDIEISLS